MCPGDLAQFSLGLLGWKVTLGGSREHESWALLLVWCWDSFQGPAAVDSQSAALPTQELGYCPLAATAATFPSRC